MIKLKYTVYNIEWDKVWQKEFRWTCDIKGNAEWNTPTRIVIVPNSEEIRLEYGDHNKYGGTVWRPLKTLSERVLKDLVPLIKIEEKGRATLVKSLLDNNNQASKMWRTVLTAFIKGSDSEV